MSVLNKRIAKKVFSRCGYKRYKDYKKAVLKPWEEYVREQKKWEKSGRPITEEEMQEYLELGIYSVDEIRSRFNVIES